MKPKLLLLIAMTVCTFVLNGQIIHVPADQPTVQAGIDAAIDGDTVLVSDGTYLENIDFSGKAITVASYLIMDSDTNHINNTILDGSDSADPDYGSVVTFMNGEDTTSILCGFTITGGTGNHFINTRLGGGIACFNSGAKIVNNRIINNEVYDNFYAGGGGIGCISQSIEYWIIVKDNLISGNTCESTHSPFGGGIFSSSNTICINNKILNNECTSEPYAEGGGLLLQKIDVFTPTFLVVNNWILNNNLNGNEIYGCGMSILGGQGMVTGNTIKYNSGSANELAIGGGISLFYSTGEFHLRDNEIGFQILTAPNSQGGGIALSDCYEEVVIQNNLIESNELIGSYICGGGGLVIARIPEIEVSGNQFIGNIASGVEYSQGAALWCESVQGKTSFMDNLFAFNTGSGTGFGGGVGLFNTYMSEVEISRNVFQNNEMSNGAGLWIANSYSMTVSNNMFIENWASSEGGGLMMRYIPVGSAQMISITSQIKPMDDRSIYSDTVFSHPLIINNSFFQNSADNYGGAIYCDYEEGFPLIVNSVFWENDADTSNEIYYTGPYPLWIAHCDLDTTALTGISGKWDGENNILEDPGFTDTLCHIDGTSPCVDFGTDSLEYAGTWYYAPGMDFEGNPRPYGDGGIDIGADECDIFTRIFNISLPGEDDAILLENRPNPFNTSTDITFILDKERMVSLKIFDLSGHEIQTLVSGRFSQGNHRTTYHAGGLPRGTYILELIAGNQRVTKKIVVH